jgi:hypothetical protein
MRKLLPILALLICASLLLWGATTGTLAIASDANDTRRWDGAGNWDVTGSMYVGNLAGEHGRASYRFATGVTDMGGSTITACTFSIYSTTGSGAPSIKLNMQLAAAPAAPTDGATFDTAFGNITTAKVDWDGDPGGFARHTADDCSAVMQEVVDTYNPTAIQVFLSDDGSASGVYGTFGSYSGSPSWAANLEVTYTPAAAGGVRRRVILVQ